MLRRRSLKSTSDLKRRKSTSTVTGVRLEHIDPALAQRDAQIAALQAYVQAQKRSKAEMPLFPPTPDTSPRRHGAGGSGLTKGESVTPRPGPRNSKELSRQQSVRFMGPCSVPGKTLGDLGAKESNNSRKIGSGPARPRDDPDTWSFQSSIREGNDCTGQEPQEPCRPPPPVSLPGIAADYLTAMAAEDEYYTPEDDIASAPSSYRRLRRSRSMFSSHRHGDKRTQEGSLTPVSVRPPHPSSIRKMANSDPRDTKASQSSPSLRAPKSMSFLKNRSTIRSGSARHTEDDKDARHAEPSHISEDDSHISDRDALRAASKTSSLFGSRRQRNETGMRKSLRSGGSADGGGLFSASPRAPLDKDERFTTKARKASRSLKTKLKNFFSLSKSEDGPAALPIQHIEAQRTHVSEGFGSIRSSSVENVAQDSEDWKAIHHVPSKVPSLHAAPSHLIRSNKGSLESLASERERKVSDDKSLTSWTNSGPSTLTSQEQQQWREWERQRLSIIKEIGAHAPSPSIRRQALESDLFRRAEDPHGHEMAPRHVDSQRIYSALMKRIHDPHVPELGKQGPKQEHKHQYPFHPKLSFEAEPDKEATPKAIQDPASSLFRGACLEQPADTPTRVSRHTSQSDAQVLESTAFRTGSPSTPTPRRAHFGFARKQAKGLSAAFKTSIIQPNSHNTSNLQASASDPFQEDSSGTANSAGGYNDEKPGSRQDGDSPPFDTPNAHLFRTTSPYRQTLRNSMEMEKIARSNLGQDFESQYSENETQIHVNINHEVFKAGSGGGDDLDYTESVYSTDDATPGRAQEGARTTTNSGYSRITNEKADPSPSPPRTYRPAGYRVDSTASSIDWKTWLAANVAKEEQSPHRPSIPSEVEYALPSMPKSFYGGHVREAAQIHEEPDDESPELSLEVPTHKPTLPTTPLANVEPNVVKLSPLQRSVKRTTPPSNGRLSLLENDSPSGEGGAPPIPPKSLLRSTPSPMRRSGPNTGSYGHVGHHHVSTASVMSSPGLTAAVQRQFGPVHTTSKYGDVCNRQRPMPRDQERYTEDCSDEGSAEEHIRRSGGLAGGQRRMMLVNGSGHRARMAESEISGRRQTVNGSDDGAPVFL